MASKGLVENLLDNYKQFCSKNKISNFPTSIGGLPIDIQKHEINDEKLSAVIDGFLKSIFIPILSESLFLKICIWDPFRKESPDNWALSKGGINKIEEQLKKYYKEIEKEKINFIYLIYKVLEKDIIKITVPHNSISSPTSDPDVKSLISRYAGNKEIERQLNQTISFHSAFKDNKNHVYTYYIPTEFLYQRNLGIGGLIIVSNKDFENNFLIGLKIVTEDFLSKIGVYYLFQNFLHHTLRSAVAAIMARNMSHNIGSHVLNYLSKPEEINTLWFMEEKNEPY